MINRKLQVGDWFRFVKLPRMPKVNPVLLSGNWRVFKASPDGGGYGHDGYYPNEWLVKAASEKDPSATISFFQRDSLFDGVPDRDIELVEGKPSLDEMRKQAIRKALVEWLEGHGAITINDESDKPLSYVDFTVDLNVLAECIANELKSFPPQ